MNNTQKILEIIKKKEEHLKNKRNYITNLALNKINHTFITGKCLECERLDNELKKYINN